MFSLPLGMESGYPLALLVHNLFFFFTRILKLINSPELTMPGKQQKDYYFFKKDQRDKEQSVSGFRIQSKVLESSSGSRKPEPLLFSWSTKIGRGRRDPGEKADLATLSPMAPCYLVMKDKSVWHCFFYPLSSVLLSTSLGVSLGSYRGTPDSLSVVTMLQKPQQGQW